jgi:hypothetical protein
MLCEGKIHVSVTKDCMMPVDKKLGHTALWKDGNMPTKVEGKVGKIACKLES